MSKWKEMLEEMNSQEAKALLTDMKTFTEQTGYGLANVWGAYHNCNLPLARNLLNEHMAINYMAEHSYKKA